MKGWWVDLDGLEGLMCAYAPAGELHFLVNIAVCWAMELLELRHIRAFQCNSEHR